MAAVDMDWGGSVGGGGQNVAFQTCIAELLPVRLPIPGNWPVIASFGCSTPAASYHIYYSIF